MTGNNQNANTSPLVSVIMLAYDHEKFIGEAIESIVHQKTDFQFQLIIGEDCSTDNTRNICREYKSKYPDKIILLSPDKNEGSILNLFNCYEQALGSQYFAMCEGDDYWIDLNKLQKQVDFMSKNKDFAICFTNSRVEYFDEKKSSYELNEGIKKDVFTLSDLIGEDEIWFMATATLLIRTDSLGPFPDWLRKSKSGDIPMAILAARKGKIKYLPSVTAVYRKHAGGISLTDHKDDEGFLRNRIYMYSNLNADTGFKFNERFSRNIARYYYMILNSVQFEGMYLKKIPIIWTYFRLTFPRIPKLKLVVRDHIIPSIVMDFVRKIKRKLGLIPTN